MTKHERDQVVDAFKSRAEAEAKVRAASEILVRDLPASGQAYAIPGTPYTVARTGGTLAVKTVRASSIDDLIT